MTPCTAEPARVVAALQRLWGREALCGGAGGRHGGCWKRNGEQIAPCQRCSSVGVTHGGHQEWIPAGAFVPPKDLRAKGALPAR